MELYYDKNSQKLAMIKSDTNELVFESEVVICRHKLDKLLSHLTTS